ncbi:MAG: adenylate/guanylate cyclase domain-containing protein [Saprospiraceae bacterium]|nr:adenylate/guanylate cyclase domain-containing protein [Saprospiraceae bacterium]
MQTRRQLAAIMFTDIVGYTVMMQKDEAQAVRIRERHREVFQRQHLEFKGEIIQYFGDGTLSLFNSSVQAVRCAIAIQQEMREAPKVPLRIGIHSGDIIRTEEEVIGDGVNLASRIENLAIAGSILISPQIYYQIKNQGIEVISLGSFQMKNVTNPIEVFAISDVGLKVPSIRDNQSHIPKIIEATYPQAAGDEKSIAILPFVNMSNDGEQEYFCDGITEEIIHSLSHLKGLKVIARTSVFAFKGRNEDIRHIGKELQVSTILEGSVRKSETRLRITAQLIKALDGSHIWSEKYDRELSDIFEIQDEISLSIVNMLKIELLGEERRRVLDNQTKNIEAYNLYLKGQYEWYKRTKAGMTKSIDLYADALKLDHDYILAHVGIANAYIALCDWGEMKPRDGLPKARKILNEALDKNNQLGEIHAALTYLNICEWNVKGVLECYQKGIEANPKLPVLHHFISVADNVLGNFDEAIRSNQIARKLDPLSLIFNFAYGHTLI